MSQNEGLNRRAFLRNAGMTALVGATVGTGGSVAAAAAYWSAATRGWCRARANSAVTV